MRSVLKSYHKYKMSTYVKKIIQNDVIFFCYDTNKFNKMNSIDTIPLLSKSDNKPTEYVIRRKTLWILVSEVGNIKLIIHQKCDKHFISILEAIVRNENEIVSIL